MILTMQGQCRATSSWGMQVPEVPKMGQVNGEGNRSRPCRGIANFLSGKKQTAWVRNRTEHCTILDETNLPNWNIKESSDKGSRQNFATILILLQLRDFSPFYQNWLVSLANCGTWMVESWSFVGCLVRWGVKDQRDSCRLHPALERLNPRHRKGSLSAGQRRRLGSNPISLIGS